MDEIPNREPELSSTNSTSQAGKDEPEVFAHPDITTGTVLHGVTYPNDQKRLKPHETDSPMAYLNRGVEYYKKGDLDHAIADFDQAILLNLDFAEAYNDRGLCYTTKGNLDRAIMDFDQAIQLRPDFSEAYSNRGTAYKSKYDFEQAINDYDHAIQLKPDFAAAYNNLGDVYRTTGDFVWAISNYDKALQLRPDYDEAYYSRILACFEIDEIKRSSSNADDYYQLGLAYANIGEVGKAITDFNKALKLSRDTNFTHWIQKRLQWLEGK
jgi:tetratricopeptide (TPR) repeat protein